MVIAIVALLASIAMVAMNNARRDSRNTKRKADLKQITTALEIYFDTYKQYPFNGPGGYNEIDQTIEDTYHWDSSCGNVGEDNPNDHFLTSLSDKRIIITLPDDPISKNLYCYFYTSTTYSDEYIKGYRLMTYLENKTGENNCPPPLSGLPSNFICLSQNY